MAAPKRTYGKGGTASSKAVLRDVFGDENEIEGGMFKMSLGQVVSPSLPDDVAKPVSPPPASTIARKSKDIDCTPVRYPYFLSSSLSRVLPRCWTDSGH
jgi:hypothetical protein